MSNGEQARADDEVSSKKLIYKLTEITGIYSMSRSSIYRAMEHDGFPKPIKLTSRSVGWWKHSVENWFATRPAGIAPCADNGQYQTQEYLTSRPSSGNA
jgi:prophage regulatory protein